MFNLPSISYSSMGSPIKVNGMKEIPIYHLKTLMLLQNVGEIISIIKFLMLSKTYGKTTISQETQIESMFLALNPTSLLFVIQKKLVMMIQESSLYQEKVLFMCHFYIADSATNMLLTMSMNVMMIPHGILMMGTYLMFLILIKSSQLNQLLRLFPHTPSLFNPLINPLEDKILAMNGLLKHLLQNPYSKPILPLHSGVVWS